MVEFCPDCGGLLRKRTKNGTTFLFCRCGYEKKLEPNNAEKQKRIAKKKKKLEENLIVVNHDDKITVHPIVERICPKCGFNEAETWQEQTRSADEPSTTFFRCLKCKKTWREY